MARKICAAMVFACFAVPAAAHADGPSVLGLGGGNVAVKASNGRVSYAAVPGRRTTLVEAIASADGSILSVRMRGRFEVPLVTDSGIAAGISANGRALVLERPRTRFPERTSRLAILAAGTLRTRRIVTLRGDFSFDAISPNGRWIYLTEYTSRRNADDYRVRALDARTGRLRPGAIVDRTEPDEAMQGEPQWRVTSADGRWAYTLYGGAGETFVHALDTAGRRARCIDLPASLNASAYPTWSLALTNDGRELVVRGLHGPVATVDTATWKVTRAPRVRTTTPERSRTTERGSTGASELAVAIGAAAVLLGAALVAVRIRRRLAADR